MGRPLVDISGQRFGRLVVIARGASGAGRSYWLCRCDCGAEKQVAANALKSHGTKSCGCLNRQVSAARNGEEKFIHGGARTKLYVVWQSMRRRCYEKTCAAYKHYGARGIRICEPWSEFKTFQSWAKSSGYKQGLSIDRIDVDGNYCPSNCRWATAEQQANNRRNNVMISFQGSRKTISQFARERGFPPSTIHQRIRVLGWSVERALTTPIRFSRKPSCL